MAGLHAEQGPGTVHTSNSAEDGFTAVGDDDDDDNIYHQYTSGFAQSPIAHQNETDTQTYPHIEDADTEKFDLA